MNCSLCQCKIAMTLQKLSNLIEHGENRVICSSCSYIKNERSVVTIFDNMENVDVVYFLGWVATIGMYDNDKVLICTSDNTFRKLYDTLFNTISGENHSVFEIHYKNNVVIEKIGMICSMENPVYFSAFLRGCFDASGMIKMLHDGNVRISFIARITNIIEAFGKKIDIPFNTTILENVQYIVIDDFNAIDFLGKIYSNEVTCMRSDGKFNMYKNILHTYIRCDAITVVMRHPDAVKPLKVRESDVGFDITVIGLHKIVGDVYFYSTGISVKPPIGYYCEIVPRSSVSKTGFMLANSVGIIDPTYTGELFIALRKVDPKLPDLELPCRIGQLIPTKAYYPELVFVDSLSETNRGSGGFGSTGK